MTAAARVLLAVALRPDLWTTAVRQLLALAPRRWWSRRPFLPVPDPDYLTFRLQTMYGGSKPEPVAADVVSYLEWCRFYRHSLR